MISLMLTGVDWWIGVLWLIGGWSMVMTVGSWWAGLVVELAVSSWVGAGGELISVV